MRKIANHNPKPNWPYYLVAMIICGGLLAAYASAEAARVDGPGDRLETESPTTPAPTTDPVTPGDPASYRGTYGQCPFYENAIKGCVPPPDVECNADWSNCQPKAQPAPEPPKKGCYE